MLLVLGATDFELSGLRPTAAAGPDRSRIVVVRTGVGREAVVKAMRRIMKDSRPASILSVGFAGALVPGMKAGSSLLVRRVGVAGDVRPTLEAGRSDPVRGDGGGPFVAERETSAVNGRVNMRSVNPALEGRDLALDPGLLGWAAHLLAPYGTVVADLLTAPHLVASPSEKDRLGRASKTPAVDMEGYWIACAAAEAGVPLLSLKVISDEVDQRLPGGPHLMGGPSWRLARHLLGRPGEVADFPRLAHTAFVARRALRLLAGELVRHWADDSKGGLVK